jgi:TPR repeat protein
MKNPNWSKYYGKLANVKMLQKLAKDKNNGWYYTGCVRTYSYNFTSLLGCMAENPPRVRIDISLDRKGIIADLSVKTQIWMDSPPTVGYSNCGVPPVGADLKRVKEIIQSVLATNAAPVTQKTKATATVARDAKEAKTKQAEKDFQQGLQNLNDDPAKRDSALKLIHQAAAAGDHSAQFWCAALYGNGSHGIKKDDKLSMKYYEMALEVK